MHNVNERSQNCTSSNVGYADSLLTNYATEMTPLTPSTCLFEGSNVRAYKLWPLVTEAGSLDDVISDRLPTLAV